MNMQDFDAPDEEQVALHQRRSFEYSQAALRQAAGVESIYVDHPRFKKVVAACDRIFQLGKELSIPQGLLLEGPPGSGKTALIRYLRDSVPASTLFEPGAGVIALRAPRNPSLGHMVSSLLTHLRHPFRDVTERNLSTRRMAVIDAMRARGTRLLAIDEGHHLAATAKHNLKHLNEGSAVTDYIREMMDEVPLAVVITGTEGLRNLAETDKHLGSRIVGSFALQNFALGDSWRGFVKAFCNGSRGFDISFLASEHETQRLHQVCCGNLREFKRIVTEAVLIAYDAGHMALDGPTMKKAFAAVYGQNSQRSCPYE